MPPNNIGRLQPDRSYSASLRWRTLLFNRLPLVAGPLRRLAASRLAAACKKVDPIAVRTLAEGLNLPLDRNLEEKIKDCLLQVNSEAGISELWEAWLISRNTILTSILIQKDQAAASSSSANVISLLKLKQYMAIRSGGINVVSPLLAACNDQDAEIASSARQLLGQLKNPAAIECLCQVWVENRSSLLEQVIRDAGYTARKPVQLKILVELKFNRLAQVLNGGAKTVAPLVQACQDADLEISNAAKSCLLNLQNQDAIDEICRLWAEGRQSFVEAVIIKAAYLPKRTLPVQILLALKTGRVELVQNIPVEGLPALLAACADADGEIAARARSAAQILKNPATIHSICQRVIDTGDSLCAEIAINAGYHPESAEQSALFYFLTGQSQRYEAIDFDCRIMQAVYAAASTSLKSRIAHQVQVSGKTPYLSILAGMDFKTRAAGFVDGETEMLVRILSQNQEYERLWKLVFELPVAWSIEILRILAPCAWRPAKENEALLFAQLAQLSYRDIISTAKELAFVLPPAVQRSSLRIHGRINDLAFDPANRLLAIGTSVRKLGLWDFQKGAMARILTGFKHSISQIAYCGETLLCGQRSNRDALCSIFGWYNDQSFLLGSHYGAVTSLLPVDQTRLLSTGRDRKAVLWDIPARKAISESQFDFWPRSSALAPDGRSAALVHEGLSLVSLPDLASVSKAISNHTLPGMHKSAARVAAFTPDGDSILIGQFNGQIVRYQGLNDIKSLTKSLVRSDGSSMIGLQFIPTHSVLVSANREGSIHFTRWPEQESLGKTISTGKLLSSLYITPDGSFMASGANDATISLWDLRVQDLPSLFSAPLASIRPGQAAAITSMLEEANIPFAVRNTLSFMSILIQQRFKFDVEICEAPTIARGEFDVIID